MKILNKYIYILLLVLFMLLTSKNIIPNTPNHIGFIHIGFTNQDIGYITGHSQNNYFILVTKDGGITWEKRYTSKIFINNIIFSNESEGYGIVNNTTVVATRDLGKHWNTIYNNLSLDLMGMCITKDNIIWVLDRQGALLSTNDQGLSWQISKLDVNACSIKFSDTTHGYITGTNAIFITSDAGKSWTKQSLNSNDLFYIAFAKDNDVIIFNSEDILWSDNFGETWKIFTPPRQPIAFAYFIDSQYGWMLSSHDVGYPYEASPSALLYSKDYGETWQIPKDPIKPHSWQQNLFNTTKGRESFFFNVYFKDLNTGWLIGDGENNLFKTIDEGIHWEKMNLDSIILE